MSDLPLSTGDAARADGERLALVTSSGTEWTYRRLAQEVAGATAALDATGVGAGDRVVVAPTRTVASLVTLHAIFEVGATAVLLQPSWTGRERSAALELVADAHRLDEVPLEWTRGAEIPAPRLAYDPRSPLVIAFTSGTTGESRGVVSSRAAWIASAHASAANLGWECDDRWLLCMPPAHVGGLSILIRALIARRAVALYDEPSFAVDNVRAFMDRGRVSLASMVPTMLHRLLGDEGWAAPLSLRALLLGGAGCRDALLRRAIERGLPIQTTYGLTETCGQVTTQRRVSLTDEVGDAGLPLPGWEVSAPGGHIRVRGGALFDGYVSPGELASPELEADGWWTTGDLGEVDEEGRLWVRGRRDDLIISGGENVYAAEVEAALNELPGVQESCVFAIEDEEWGQAVAAVVVVAGGDLDLDRLRRGASAVLAPHKRPKAWAVANELSRTESGKLRRDRVAAAHREALYRG